MPQFAANGEIEWGKIIANFGVCGSANIFDKSDEWEVDPGVGIGIEDISIDSDGNFDISFKFHKGLLGAEIDLDINRVGEILWDRIEYQLSCLNTIYQSLRGGTN